MAPPASLTFGWVEAGGVSLWPTGRENVEHEPLQADGWSATGPRRNELPDGYEVSSTSDRIGVWTRTREDFDELANILALMTSAQARLDAQTTGHVLDDVPVLADNQDTRQAISDMREANVRQDRLLRRMAPDLY